MDHGAVLVKWSHRDSHPDFRLAEPASSCWTMTPKRKPWESNPQAASVPPPAFQAGSSAVRMASVVKLRGLESNQHRDVQSVPSCHWKTPQCLSFPDMSRPSEVRGEGIEPPSPGSKPGGLPLTDPRECPAGVEPASPAWKAGASAGRPRAREAEGERVELSRLIARPLSRRVPSPIGLPFRVKAAAAGIEPASGRLTAAYPYQHGFHRNQSQDGRI